MTITPDSHLIMIKGVIQDGEYDNILNDEHQNGWDCCWCEDIVFGRIHDGNIEYHPIGCQGAGRNKDFGDLNSMSQPRKARECIRRITNF